MSLHPCELVCPLTLEGAARAVGVRARPWPFDASAECSGLRVQRCRLACRYCARDDAVVTAVADQVLGYAAAADQEVGSCRAGHGRPGTRHQRCRCDPVRPAKRRLKRRSGDRLHRATCVRSRNAVRCGQGGPDHEHDNDAEGSDNDSTKPTSLTAAAHRTTDRGWQRTGPHTGWGTGFLLARREAPSTAMPASRLIVCSEPLL